MINSHLLRDIDIRDWRDIEISFQGADLLLGNGFSLNLSSVFNYNSLFNDFLSRCQVNDVQVFQGFGTTNFELIQEQLKGAKKVNELFRLPTEPIESAMQKLRDGLITSVQNNHPPASSVDFSKLAQISETLDQFGDIFTSNYDLYLYHIIMISKDRYREDKRVRPYNDYFWSRYDDRFLEFMDYQNYKHYKHVYYLHGALFLFAGYQLGYYNDLKLRSGVNFELLENVAAMIRHGALPLFVSESTSDDKMRSITRSPYLRFAYSNFTNASKWLVIYGNSLSSQDEHIVRALGREIRNIAVSVYIGEKLPEQLKAEVFEMRAKLATHHVVFFDSSTLFGS